MVKYIKLKEFTQPEMEKNTAEFKARIKGLKSEELKKLEQQLIADFDAINETRKTKEFKLPKDNWETIAPQVCAFLDKSDVAWNVGFVLIGIYEFWKQEKNPGKIPFATFELTIQKLGDTTYKGYDEWTAIAAVNKYFEPIHPEYAEIVMGMRYLGMLHSTVQDELGLANPIAPQE